MNLVKVKCAFCKKEYFRQAGRVNEAKKFGWNQYCSKECQNKAKTKRQVLVCENCGKVFERPLTHISAHNYCSQSCAAQINNRKHPKRKAELSTCIECGGQFRKSTNNIKYCSLSCRRKAKQKTPEELIKIIKENAKKLKRVPAERELKEIIDSSIRTFGSWNNAIIAAGLQPNRSHSQRMYKRTSAMALDGHLCDSISETIIDNWFAKNRILHERNVNYPDTNHKVDWRINSGGQNIFVEYFGLANDSPRYDRTVKNKINLCRKYNLTLVAIYPSDLYPREHFETKLRDKFKNLLNF